MNTLSFHTSYDWPNKSCNRGVLCVSAFRSDLKMISNARFLTWPRFLSRLPLASDVMR